MNGLSASEPVTAGPGKSVRDGLADPEVNRRLRAIIRAGLGRSAPDAGRQCDAAVEEVFSDVCSRALAVADRYDASQGNVLNWLGGFAWKILHERRKPRPEPLPTLDTQEPDHGPSIPDMVANRIDVERLLAVLPADERQLLRWDLESWTAAEIGEELNLTAAAVRVRLHRLRRKARELLGGPPTGGADHE
jgi:RNA polymerase sigma factor (sigma-70 family)